MRGSFIRNLGFIAETSHPEILHRGTYYSLAFFFFSLSLLAYYSGECTFFLSVNVRAMANRITALFF